MEFSVNTVTRIDQLSDLRKYILRVKIQKNSIETKSHLNRYSYYNNVKKTFLTLIYLKKLVVGKSEQFIQIFVLIDRHY